MSKTDIQCQCTRCRFKHMESDRVAKPRKDSCAGDVSTIQELVCPKCGCKSFYDLRPMVAWCWASGLIEFGEAMPADSADGSGAIQIATGPKCYLPTVLSVLARQGFGDSDGKLLVPGVPEADSQKAKGDALETWLAWCAKGNGKKGRYGVVFGGAA